MKIPSTVQSGQRLVLVKTPTGFLKQHVQRNAVTINGDLAASTTNCIAIQHLGQVGAIRHATFAQLRTTGMTVNTSALR